MRFATWAAWAASIGLALGCGLASAQRLPMPATDDNFAGAALTAGVQATRAQCDAIEGAVWADAGAHGAECLRYWTAGLVQGAPQPVMVYLPPDQLSFGQPAAGYTRLSPSRLGQLVAQMQQRVGVPLLFLARPGTFGASGDHRDRRREAEARLVSAGLDALKARLGIGSWVLTGLSGGGHTVAALIGWRTDVVCAVPASAVSSPRMRWRLLGQTTDITGHDDSYEPVDHLRREVHPALRVFVLGDPADRNVPWATQQPLAERLRTLGIETTVLQAEGSDSDRHALSESTRVIGAACARGASTGDIRALAARGLKG